MRKDSELYLGIGAGRGPGDILGLVRLFLQVLNIPYVHLKAARWSTVPPHLRDAAQFVIIIGTKALLEGDLARSHCSPAMAVPPLGPLPLNRPL
jgi:hypothetical protein